MSETRMQSVSPGRRLLLEMIRALRFGQILDLRIRGGQPTFDPPPRVIRTVKFGSDAGSGLVLSPTDHVLKRQVVELLQELDRLQDGTIACLEVQNGLPFRIVLEQPLDRLGRPDGESVFNG